MAKDKEVLRVPLNFADRLKFVQIIFDARQTGLGWKSSFKKANDALPASKKISDGIDHPNKLTWMIPMYEALEKKLGPVKGKQDKQPLSDAEKKLFAESVFEAYRNNPAGGYSNAIGEAKKTIPGKIGATVSGVHHLVWLKPMLDKLEAKVDKVSVPLVKVGRPPFSEDERMTFAKHFFEFKKANPEAKTLHAIHAANALMPLDRKIGAAIDSVKQIPWIIPLLEQLENPPKEPSRFDCKLSDQEKEQFTEIVYRLRKGGATGARCMREANKFMPEGHKLASIHPSGVPWLMRALAKLEEADTSRVVIDHRGVLPKAEESLTEFKKDRKHSETKTYWNEDDKNYFAEITYQLKMCNPGWGWQKILDEANQEMPGHKRRPKMPPSPSQMPWLGALLDKIAKRPAPMREPEPVKIPEIAQPTPAPMMDMQAMMMAAFEKVVREQLAGGISMPAAINGTPKPEVERPQKKKVIVVGLLPVQTNDIQKRFGHIFDFKFIGSNVPNQQIRESIKHGDIGVLMTRFTSHPTQAAMRDHPGFTFCNGNSTALENLLQEKVTKLNAGQ
jgi:hypothetical protein